MTTYVIGDVQGCFAPLQQLLAHIQFDQDQDTLWFTGDLVNRGPQSLEVLRFVKSLGARHQTILGNHDLHLLAVASGVREPNPKDTLSDILSAPDRDELITWLRQQPLMMYDKAHHAVLCHAGLAPNWTLNQAEQLAHEVETALQGDDMIPFLQNMYGNQPDLWHDSLTGLDRLRCITNYFTRMRYCHRDGRLDLSYKGTLKDMPNQLIPWFDVASRVNKDVTILFGHWAALNGEADVPNVYALDTGCVWGNCLTAMDLTSKKRYQVACG